MHTSNCNPKSAARQGVVAVVAVTLYALGCAGSAAAADFAEPQAAVDAAAESLAARPNIPWYDSKTDDFRAAEVQPPRQNRGNSNFELSGLMLRLGWILLAALLVYLVYLIARAFLDQEVADSQQVERRPVGGDISRVEELPVVLKKSPADYLDEAQRLYRKGDYAQAIIYLFSHQLLQLDRRHWLRLVKGKTNRQYLRELRRSAAPASEELASLFEATVLLFEEVFFGKRLPHREAIDATWNSIPRFESLVSATEEKAA